MPASSLNFPLSPEQRPDSSAPNAPRAAAKSAEDVTEVTPFPSGRGRWWIFLLLVLALGFAVYHPVRHFDFISLDDNQYIKENPWLERGLSWETVHWAFVANLSEFSRRAEYWSPITLLSRLTDAQIYGIKPGPFHITSVLIHLLNAYLLGLALWSLSGCWRRSVAVALLFVVHPQNVEAVCWLSARKDLLSATFFFVTLLAYAYYAHRQTRGRYALLLGAYTLCLMAKPMGVSIPFVLLLLDGWPLGRWQKAGSSRTAIFQLLAEKFPLLIMAGVAAILAVLSQQDWKALDAGASYSIWVRIANALISYATYLRRVFWPNDLTVFYPHPGNLISFPWAAASAALLVALTVAAWLLRQRAPFLLMGWLWFGVVLGPVIGLVQVGGQAMADRYAYPSMIGIFIAIVWAVASISVNHRSAAYAAGSLALAAFAWVAAWQVGFWRNAEVAFTRAIAVTHGNGLAYLNLADACFDRKDYESARRNYELAREIAPHSSLILNDIGCTEALMGHDERAVVAYQKALALNPYNEYSLLFLGRIFKAHGKNHNAEELFLRLAEVKPEIPQPYVELGEIYAAQGRWGDAVRNWNAYLAIHPDDVLARQKLARAKTATK